MATFLEDLLKRTREGLPRFIAEQEATRLGVSKQFAEALAPTPIAPEIPPISAPAAPDTITADDLAPRPDVTFVKPEIEEPPKIELTEQEKKQVSAEEDIQKARELLAQKPTFEAEKKLEFGIEAKKEAFESINRQIRDISRQQELVPLTIERESLGRGRTVGGVMPLEIGRRRALAYDGLILSSRLDAAKGDLDTAERKVLDAIQTKFGPLEAKLKAQEDNLKIIKDSPTTTVQDKNRATQLQIEIDARKAQVEKAKKEQEEVLKLVNKTAEELAKREKLTIDANNELSLVAKEADSVLTATNRLAPFLKEEEKGQTEFERAFARQFGRLPTLDEIRAEQKKTENKLTLSEAKSLNLPTSLVGMSEEDIGRDLESSTPPQWFKESLEEKLQASTTPETLNSAWKEFKKTATKKTTSSTSKTKLDTLLERIQ